MKIINTKKIENIFSSKKLKNTHTKCGKIIIDYREKNSLVPAKLKNLGFELEFRELKIADYIVKDTAIERKTIEDFLSSMINKRLLKQLEELREYKKRILIIEGYEEKNLYDDSPNGINGNAIRGFLISIIHKHKVPIIFTKNPEDTAKFILVIYKKAEKETSLKTKKRNLTKREQMQFILEGFPGIGPKNAKKLLKEFKTLKNTFNSSQEKLEKILGKKSEIFKKIIEENY